MVLGEIQKRRSEAESNVYSLCVHVPQRRDARATSVAGCQRPGASLSSVGERWGSPAALRSPAAARDALLHQPRRKFLRLSVAHPGRPKLGAHGFRPRLWQTKRITAHSDGARCPIPLGSFSDGSQVAILKTDWNTGQIRFIPLGGEEPRTVTVKGYVNLDSLDWAPDSRSVFVGTWGPGGATLLHIDLSGNAQPIWHEPQPGTTFGIPAPDGRHLTMWGVSAHANVWMIDNF